MKKNKIIFWTATIIIALMEAVMPIGTWIFAPEFMTVGTKALGYPDYFAYSLVIAKVLGVIAITSPKIPSKMKEWAYAGFTFNFLFASISHFAIDGMDFQSFFPLIFLGILGISYIYCHKLYSTKNS